jgi:hypothetical protein
MLNSSTLSGEEKRASSGTVQKAKCFQRIIAVLRNTAVISAAVE